MYCDVFLWLMVLEPLISLGLQLSDGGDKTWRNVHVLTGWHSICIVLFAPIDECFLAVDFCDGWM